MKKLLTWAITFMLIATLIGCTEQPTYTTFTLDDSDTCINITHCHCGGNEKWYVEGDDIDTFRAWLGNLNCSPVEFAKGESPSDMMGGDVYLYEFTGGTLSSLTYTYIGRDGYYLRIDGNWYHITNPSEPPFKKP